MRRTVTMITAIAIGMAATAASAAKRPPPPIVAKVTTKFAALDANNDKSLDSSEWAATSAPPNSFGFVDLNDNGSIGLYELIRVTVAKIVAKRR